MQQRLRQGPRSACDFTYSPLRNTQGHCIDDICTKTKQARGNFSAFKQHMLKHQLLHSLASIVPLAYFAFKHTIQEYEALAATL